MSTRKLKRYYQRWERKTWHWEAIVNRVGTARYMSGPAGYTSTTVEHLRTCRRAVDWAASNLKQRGWYIA